MGFRHTLVTVIVIVGHLASGRPESDANGDRFRSYQRQFLRGFADVERLQVDPIIDDALTHLHRNWLHHRPPPRVFRISFGIPVSFIQRSRVRFNPTRDRPIGVGSFGTVYKASLDGVVPVAVKFFNNHTAMADSIHEFRNELRGSYLTVGLPNVAPFVGFIVDRTLGPGIVTRFGEGGTVSQFLERNKFIPAHIRLRLAAELCTGVAGMHARNVVHGDINPKNVVIGFPNGVVGKFEVWIIDLSSARALSAQYIPNMMTCTISYASPEQVRAGVTGDFRWGAPSDVWSLAMVALYCINGVAWEPEVLKRPQIGNDIFKACQLYLKELDDGRIWPALPPNLVSKSTADVIHACFTMDPERRPSSAALAAALEQEAYRLELLST